MNRWGYDDAYEDAHDDYYDDEEEDDGDFSVPLKPKAVPRAAPAPKKTPSKKPTPLAKPKPPPPQSSTDQSMKQAPLSEFQLEEELAKLCSEDSDSGELESLHLVVLGHVDAGKSTLMGRLLHDLGVISQRQIHKYQKEATQAGKGSFSWAWVLDERPEERERGITVDVATIQFKTEKFNITLLDAPGHKDFVPNMITGAAQADAALLVVDGSIGGFEAGFEEGVYCGQTREHAQLARSLGIEQIAIIVTKLDTVESSKDRFGFIQSEMTPFLELCGFGRQAIQWVLASAPTGLNMIKAPPLQEPQLSWYKGPTVLQAINNFHSITRTYNAPLRVPVSEVFKSRTLGLAINGKIESGAVRVGTRIWILPAMESATVKGIETSGKGVNFAKAGDSCNIGLIGIEERQLFVGSVLSEEGWAIPVVESFECKVLVLEPPVPILPGLQVSVQCHKVKESARITRLIALLNSKTSQVSKQRPRCLLKGQTAMIEVEVSKAICVEEYANFRALGRITIRESGQTLAVGIITKIVQTKAPKASL